MAHVAFWGCFIPGRFPFMEKSIRVVLDALRVDYVDAAGFTCCPEKSVMKNAAELDWLVTAARNLAVAERAGDSLFSPCNGCVGTLSGALKELLAHPRLHRQVNERLGRVGLQLTGNVQVRHLVDLLHDEVGPDLIRQEVRLPLRGLRVATHAGCHQTRPSRDLGRDDPLSPAKFDALIEALGAESVEYETKGLCCGGTMNTAGLAEQAAAMTRQKLVDLRATGVDCLAVTCPACFMQYDLVQFGLRRRGEEFDLPVVTLTDLMAVALGLDIEQLGLDMHRVPALEHVRAWQERGARAAALAEGFDETAMRVCLQCRACEQVCCSHRLDESYSPFTLMQAVLEGRAAEVLASEDVWKCVECYECQERCFQRFGMVEAMKALKHAAIEAGQAAKGTATALAAFRRTGALAKPSQASRQKLGLPKAAEPPVKELLEVLSDD